MGKKSYYAGKIEAMKLYNTTYQSALWVLCIIGLLGCRKQASTTLKNDINAQFKPYVYGYTAGSISKTEGIKVWFVNPVAPEDKVGSEILGDVIRFTPAIKGKAVWENAYTLEFIPSQHLESDREYTASVNVGKILGKADKALGNMQFQFSTLPLNVRFEDVGLGALPEGISRNTSNIEGKLVASDYLSTEDVEKGLRISQAGNSGMVVQWQHSAADNVHLFKVVGVKRSEQASEVKILWNGSNVGIKKPLEEVLSIAAIEDFALTDVRVKDDEGFVQLTFSDRLDAAQSLDGLITLSGERQLKFLIEGNRVNVYPSGHSTRPITLTVAQAIKDETGRRLTEEKTEEITFSDAKPALRLLSKGGILPKTQGMIFPFEAVALKWVDIEVFKIYENNILQFMQTAELDEAESYDLHRVGNVIFRKKMSLKSLNALAQSKQWERYVIDLSKFINQEPGAIYQVRVGFTKGYEEYTCSGDAAGTQSLSTPTHTLSSGTASEEELVSMLDDDAWDPWSQDGFEYEEEDNPCNIAYYQSHRFIRRNILASNMGIIAKKDENNNYSVVVSNLITTEPMGGVQVNFYDFAQQKLATTTTDNNGWAVINVPKSVFAIVAKQGNESGYLKLGDGNSLSLSRFDVAGTHVEHGLKGFIYGERGVWRPGDSIYLHFVLENREKTLPQGHPASFELFDPQGKLYKTMTSSPKAGNVYAFHTATSPDAPTGTWRAKVKLGGAKFEKNIKVETVKPNRLKIDLNFGKEQLAVTDPKIQAQLLLQWLHGATASNLRAEIKMDITPQTTTFPKMDGFVFDDPARKINFEPSTIFDGNTNPEGKATVNVTLSKQPVAGKQILKFTTRAFEKGGDFSIDNISIPYDPYPAYAGIELPKNAWKMNELALQKENKINLAALSNTGTPLKNRKLTVGLYKVNWQWWWEHYETNESAYSSSTHVGAIQTDSLVTDGRGIATWTVKPNQWGRYLLRVCDQQSGHCAGDYAYAGTPDEEGSDNQNATMLVFSADKESYEVGETVKLQIPTSDVGKALVSIESGTRVLEKHWVGAKTGNTQFSFKTTADMAPNVYAHVTLIQPHAQTKNDLPIRMYGVIPIKVTNKNTILQPTITMPAVLKPEQNFNLQVKEKTGKPMTYTVAIVDDGLLDLTRFKTPDPWNHFFAREALGVKTWDLYDNVIGAYGGQLERVLSIGGDAEINTKATPRANRFKPVVLNLGPFQLAAGKTANHSIKLPNYIGSVRTMVVAADNGAYGNAEQTTPVKTALMIMPTLPRVVGPCESVDLPVNIFAMNDQIKNVQIEISSNDYFLPTQTVQRIQFDKPGDQLTKFNLAVNEKTGIGRIKITARSGSEVAYEELEIDVRNPNPFITNVAEATLENNKTWETNIKPIGTPSTNKATLEVSTIPPLNLDERLDYLVNYPHGCIEQTTSTAFPQLFVGNLLDFPETRTNEIANNIQSAIAQLRNFQQGSGSFAYWPGNPEPSLWGTNYVGHFLLEAQKAGYSVPSSTLTAWTDFQQKQAQMWKLPQTPSTWGNEAEQLMQAYRLYTLALANAPELGAMNRLREMTDLAPTPRWRLAAAYAIIGKTEVAKQLIANQTTHINTYNQQSFTFGSDLRDEAMILETLTLLNDRTTAYKVLKQIADKLASRRWYSTQSIGYALLAVGKFIGNEPQNNTLQFTYAINGAKQINVKTSKSVVQIPINPDAGANHLKVFNQANGTLFARLIQRGQPSVGDLTTPAATNLRINVQYTSTSGQPLDISRLAQGTDFVAQVTIQNPGVLGNYYEMALTQIFPAGWEIHNTRIADVGAAVKSATPKYLDQRDDRILTYFDLPANQSVTYRVQLNAAYIGKYYLPPVTTEAMYDNTINAHLPGRWVEVSL